MREKSTTIYVWIPKKEHEEIKKVAEKEKRTIASLARKTMCDFVEEYKKQNGGQI